MARISKVAARAQKELDIATQRKDVACTVAQQNVF